jgi:tetratricopeptide (TPR) repeat protein
MRQWRLIPVFALAAAMTLPAQTTGGTGGGTGGTGGGGNTGGAGGGNTGGVGGNTGGGVVNPGRNTSPFPTDQQQQQMPQMPQTIFLQGKVMLDDGTPPPEPVTIERVCGGNPRPEGYTDSKGRFSFQLGQRNNGMLADASTSSMGDASDPFGGGGFGNTSQSSRLGGSGGSSGMRIQLMGCELRASLPGYQSSIIPLSNRNPLDNPDVGTIILKRLGNREGSVFSATNAFAPKDAKKSMEKGRDLLKKKKYDEAEKEFAKAVEVYPKYSSAWFEIGKLQEAKGEIEEARKSYGQSLAADAKYTPPYQHLFMLSVKEQKWDDVADTTARLLKLNPYDFPDAYYYNAISNYNLKRLDEAEKSAKSLYDQNPKRFARAGYVLGLVMAQKEDFAGAVDHLKKYLEDTPNAPDRETVNKQLIEIEKFASGKQ